ncbi:hypothetical protein Agub_g8228 [Astrephomene gubernaculifera]|uniref:Nudix hydrolase domain-containing protein n=1 Tax=Astrephomene gubernaculifera TaxID=47775 RepID=A0AAD3HMZ1_9CHLO|nr:hypothetical protein Agub_g8228 [Astrephomene gubernaculifera]
MWGNLPTDMLRKQIAPGSHAGIAARGTPALNFTSNLLSAVGFMRSPTLAFRDDAYTTTSASSVATPVRPLSSRSDTAEHLGSSRHRNADKAAAGFGSGSKRPWRISDAPRDKLGSVFGWRTCYERINHYAAAGVIPFAYNNKERELYVLMSIQRESKGKIKDGLVYTLLGGKVANSDCNDARRTAAREAYEETHRLLRLPEVLSVLGGAAQAYGETLTAASALAPSSPTASTSSPQRQDAKGVQPAGCRGEEADAAVRGPGNSLAQASSTDSSSRSSRSGAVGYVSREGGSASRTGRSSGESRSGSSNAAVAQGGGEGPCTPYEHFPGGRYVAFALHLPDAWRLPQQFEAKIKAKDTHPEADKAVGLEWVSLKRLRQLRDSSELYQASTGAVILGHPFTMSMLRSSPSRSVGVFDWLYLLREHLRAWHARKEGPAAAAGSKEEVVKRQEGPGKGRGGGGEQGLSEVGVWGREVQQKWERKTEAVEATAATAAAKEQANVDAWTVASSPRGFEAQAGQGKGAAVSLPSKPSTTDSRGEAKSEVEAAAATVKQHPPQSLGDVLAAQAAAARRQGATPAAADGGRQRQYRPPPPMLNVPPPPPPQSSGLTTPSPPTVERGQAAGTSSSGRWPTRPPPPQRPGTPQSPPAAAAARQSPPAPLLQNLAMSLESKAALKQPSRSTQVSHQERGPPQQQQQQQKRQQQQQQQQQRGGQQQQRGGQEQSRTRGLGPHDPLRGERDQQRRRQQQQQRQSLHTLSHATAEATLEPSAASPQLPSAPLPSGLASPHDSEPRYYYRVWRKDGSSELREEQQPRPGMTVLSRQPQPAEEPRSHHPSPTPPSSPQSQSQPQPQTLVGIQGLEPPPPRHQLVSSAPPAAQQRRCSEWQPPAHPLPVQPTSSSSPQSAGGGDAGWEAEAVITSSTAVGSSASGASLDPTATPSPPMPSPSPATPPTTPAHAHAAQQQPPQQHQSQQLQSQQHQSQQPQHLPPHQLHPHPPTTSTPRDPTGTDQSSSSSSHSLHQGPDQGPQVPPPPPPLSYTVWYRDGSPVRFEGCGVRRPQATVLKANPNAARMGRS